VFDFTRLLKDKRANNRGKVKISPGTFNRGWEKAQINYELIKIEPFVTLDFSHAAEKEDC